MELLAPAGNIAAFEAAVEAGADAVYVGVPGFNARALARDCSFNELAAMTAWCRKKHKRLYLAMNSLVKEEELPQVMKTLALLEQVRPDALIVQDLGLVRLISRFFPHMPMHASTLMGAHNSLVVRYLTNLGLKRVVLARELSLEEISQIAALGETPLEVFAHGAMCFSYSGLCRFSSLHGGKSSLRGHCVQPCRRRYQWRLGGQEKKSGNQGAYLFSMNDLSGLEHLPQLQAAGVVSLKIEGRLKPVAYVRHAVRAYRLAIDALQVREKDQRQEMLAAARQHLDAALGRKKSAGFFDPGEAAQLISPHQSGNSGDLVGAVIKVKTTPARGKNALFSLSIQLRDHIKIGDRLRLHDEGSDQRASFTLRSLQVAGLRRDLAQAGELAQIETRLQGIERLRPPLQAKLYRVDVSDRHEKASPNFSSLLRKCRLKPLTLAQEEALLRQLHAEGADTQAKHAHPLLHARGSQGKRRKSKILVQPPQWWIKAAAPEALRHPFPFPVAKLVLDLNIPHLKSFLQKTQRNSVARPGLVWALPPVIREAQLSWYYEAIQALRQAGCQEFQLGHPSQALLFAPNNSTHNQQDFFLYADFSCNLLNSAALQQMAAQGMRGALFSLETDRATLSAALARHHRSKWAKELLVGVLIYGRPALFTAPLAAPHLQEKKEIQSLRGEQYFLRRQENELSLHPQRPFSLLAHLDELRQAGAGYFLADISHGPMKKEIATITALLSASATAPAIFSGNYTGVLS